MNDANVHIPVGTFVTFALQPWSAHMTTREFRSSKLHFRDSGMLCWLLVPKAANSIRVAPGSYSQALGTTAGSFSVPQTKSVPEPGTNLGFGVLGLRKARDVNLPLLRGGNFENKVAAEVHKQAQHRGERPNWWFYGDAKGLEVEWLRFQGLRQLAGEGLLRMPKVFPLRQFRWKNGVAAGWGRARVGWP